MLKPNEYGKFIRAIRKERGETLNTMAEKLDVSIAFLSALEVGKKTIPTIYVDKISRVYNFDQTQKEELASSIELSNGKVILKLDNCSEAKKEFCLLLSRNFKKLDDEKMKKLLKTLND